MTIRGWLASSYYARTRNSALLVAMLFLACAPSYTRAQAPARPAGSRVDLSSSKREERLQALEDLRLGRAQASSDTLWTAWETETDPLVKVRLLQALSLAEGGAAMTELTTVLRYEPAAMVRQAAAQELGRLAADSRAVTALLRALPEDSAPEVRYACALSLSLAAGPEAVAGLDQASRDADPALRRQAAHALKRHVGAKAKAALKRLEGDSDSGVRGAALSRL